MTECGATAVIFLLQDSDTDTTRYKDNNSLSFILFIFHFEMTVIQYLEDTDNLTEGEQEADDQPGQVLLGRLRLQVEDGGGEAAD